MGSSLSIPSPPGPPPADDHGSFGEGVIIHEEQPQDDLRVSFLAKPGAEVKGFPSTGGVYIHSCSAMELDFLGLDRFETAPPSSVPAEEDDFCARLQLLGAVWWRSVAEKDKAHAWAALRHPKDSKSKIRFLGVEEGGVWALEIERRDGVEKGVGRIENALTMEEKCRAIERFGGDFYPDPTQCPLLGDREQVRRLYNYQWY
jgi:hypothetical protein